MKKYLRLECTVCKRTVDKIVDLVHYTPDQCTITLSCEGRLLPIEYRSSGDIAVNAEPGVTDWRPRNSKVRGEVDLKEPELLALETGPLNQVVYAFYSATAPAVGAKKQLKFEVQADTPKNYRQYVFRRDATISSVSGQEDGLDKKVLRFTAYGTNPDLVDVYVNGVKKEKGDGEDNYNVYDGSTTSPAPPNTILFNTPQSFVQVDVIVSKEQAKDILTLEFTKNPGTKLVGAYENIEYVEKFEQGAWRKYYLYTLQMNGTEVPLNSIIRPVETTGFFMLARKPYTQFDRYSTIVVPLSGWSDTDIVKYHVIDKVTALRVTDTALGNVFPPLRFVKYTVENTIKTAIAGVEEQLVIDGKVIVGPDS